jgi:hypothetical protein
MLAFVHKDEHVLPAAIARRYEEGGSALAVGGGDVHFNFPNARLVDRGWWDQNKGQIVRVVRQFQRDGRIYQVSNDELGVRVRYSLPDPEHRALERVAATDTDVGAFGGGLATAAVIAWMNAGTPVVSGAPPCELDALSLRVWRAVTWWLRRSPALEILAIAKLAREVREKAEGGDTAGMQAAVDQLARIGGDLEHPARAAACNALFAFIPEPRRSQMRKLEQSALQTVLAASKPPGDEGVAQTSPPIYCVRQGSRRQPLFPC